MKSLPSRFFLAPMAELSTPALRRTVKKFDGSTALYSEMLSAGAIVSGASHNGPLVTRHGLDDPFIYQIAGNSPEVMAEACRILSRSGPFGMDINMGCPAPDIVKRGFGAKLLTDPALAREIVRACRNATDARLSVKLRTGYEKNDREEILSFIRGLVDEGVDFITVHPRYAKLSFTRSADWSLVKYIKENVPVPVIGNGDITDAPTALRRMEETGCDGIMIGREAVKSPWIFRLCAIAMQGGGELTVDIENTFMKTLDYISLYLPPRLHKSRGHRFSLYFTKNLKYGHSLFSTIRGAAEIGEMKRAVEEYFSRNPHEKQRTMELRKEGTYALSQV